MERKETPIKSSFLGFVKEARCPVCDAAIDLSVGSSSSSRLLCSGCGEYLEVAGKNLRQIEPTTVLWEPEFAAPTPWTDMARPMGTVLHFDMTAALTEMVTTKNVGTRVLDALWPPGCCVCGKAATRAETISTHFSFTPRGGGFRQLPRQEATVVAEGVPHCDEHKVGARFDRTQFSNPGHDTIVGLKFRSYAYQIEFRNLNAWKWRD
jgi:hypothetical protein